MTKVTLGHHTSPLLCHHRSDDNQQLGRGVVAIGGPKFYPHSQQLPSNLTPAEAEVKLKQRSRHLVTLWSLSTVTSA